MHNPIIFAKAERLLPGTLTDLREEWQAAERKR